MSCLAVPMTGRSRSGMLTRWLTLRHCKLFGTREECSVFKTTIIHFRKHAHTMFT